MFRLWWRDQTKPETPAPSAPADEDAGPDFMVDRDPRHNRYGSRLTVVRPLDSGFLKPETYQLIDAAITKYELPHHQSLISIGRIIPHVDAKGVRRLQAGDRELVSSYVHQLLSSMGRMRSGISGRSGLGPIFFTHVGEAVEQHCGAAVREQLQKQDYRPALELLRDYEQLPPEAQAVFNVTEREALADPKRRAPIIRQVETFYELSHASHKLREEAAPLLGDLLQTKRGEQHSRSSGTVSRSPRKDELRANKQWVTGGGVERSHASDQTVRRELRGGFGEPYPDRGR